MQRRRRPQWWGGTARFVGQSNLLLDGLTVPALAAYSLRRVRGSYAGPAVNIRRSSDNATQDIGFVGNGFDTASFSAFIGAGTGFVAIWYDQIGNANAMAIGGLTANQSPIALAVTPSGKAAVNATATTQGMIGTVPTNGSNVSFGAVANRTGNFTNYNVIVSYDGNNPGLAYVNTANGGFTIGNVNIGVTGGAACTDSAFHAGIGIMTSSTTMTVQSEVGTLATGTGTTQTGSTQIDLIGRAGFGFTGYLAEAIVWNGALPAGDVTAIFTDQKAYYGF